MEKQVSISVLQPTVVNESHPLENVASEEKHINYNKAQFPRRCVEIENGADLDKVILGDETPIPDVNIDYTREDGR